MVGADVESLERLADEMGRAARRLDDVRDRLATSVRSAVWVGAEAEAFRRSWNAHHSHVMLSAGACLHAAETELRRQAVEQTDASAADAGPRAAGLPGGGAAGLDPNGQNVVDVIEDALGWAALGVDALLESQGVVGFVGYGVDSIQVVAAGLADGWYSPSMVDEAAEAAVGVAAGVLAAAAGVSVAAGTAVAAAGAFAFGGTYWALTTEFGDHQSVGDAFGEWVSANNEPDMYAGYVTDFDGNIFEETEHFITNVLTMVGDVSDAVLASPVGQYLPPLLTASVLAGSVLDDAVRPQSPSASW
jgi:hypothetical protein